MDTDVIHQVDVAYCCSFWSCLKKYLTESYLKEVFEMEIINRMMWSSILELLLCSTSKVCTCSCSIYMFKKSLISCKVVPETFTKKYLKWNIVNVSQRQLLLALSCLSFVRLIGAACLRGITGVWSSGYLIIHTCTVTDKSERSPASIRSSTIN